MEIVSQRLTVPHKRLPERQPAKVSNVGTNSDIVFVYARWRLHGRKPQSTSKTMGYSHMGLFTAVHSSLSSLFLAPCFINYDIAGSSVSLAFFLALYSGETNTLYWQ